MAQGFGFEIERATYFFFPLFFAAGGVQALRLARAALPGTVPPPRFEAMAENHLALNAAMLRLLEIERRSLRAPDLPLGTSILILARLADY